MIEDYVGFETNVGNVMENNEGNKAKHIGFKWVVGSYERNINSLYLVHF